jgi:hypothetical protein
MYCRSVQSSSVFSFFYYVVEVCSRKFVEIYGFVEICGYLEFYYYYYYYFVVVGNLYVELLCSQYLPRGSGTGLRAA